jgi:uncharacterized protein with GYD domain
MAYYVSLVTFTESGVKNLRMTTSRAKAFEEKMATFGVRMLTTLWTIGQYDIVHVFECADDTTAATFACTLNSLGNVKSHTMRAFTAKEMTTIIDNVKTPYELLKGL